MKKQNAPTMKDVAREAGVALGTVSKVINGIPVREEYRKKVEDAIARLEGIDCGGRGTSCPDQLAKALKQAL